MGTHPIFESDFDCLTDMKIAGIILLFFNKTLGFPSALIDTQMLVDQNDGYPIQAADEILRRSRRHCGDPTDSGCTRSCWSYVTPMGRPFTECKCECFPRDA